MQPGTAKYNTASKTFSNRFDLNFIPGIRPGEGLFLLFIFAASVLVRILIMGSAPAYAGTADAGTWAALAREIRDNGFLIPASNALHYPGSAWVYPPVIPYLIALISLVTGENGMTLFYVVGSLGVIIQSLTVIPVYMAVRKIFGVQPAVISVFIFIAFPPMLYLLTWSALPQITAFFLLSLILWQFASMERNETADRKAYAFLAFLSFLLVFVHDITAFLYLLLTAVFVLFLLFRKWREKAGNERMIKASLTGFIATLAGILIWYTPRIGWLLETGSISSRNGFLASASSIFHTNLLNLAQPLAIPYSYYGLSLILLPLFLFFLVIHYIRFRDNSRNHVVLFGLTLFVVQIASLPFPVFFIRISYFLSFFYVYIAANGVYRFSYPALKGRSEEISRKLRKAARAFGIFVVVFIALYSAWGLAFEHTAHTYYLSNGDQGPGEVISAAGWISSNVNATSVVAAYGYAGFFIQGYSGNPVITNVNSSLLTQYTEVNESRAAGVIVNNPLLNTSETMNYIHQYGVSIVVTNLTSEQVPGFYTLLFSDVHIFVYGV